MTIATKKHVTKLFNSQALGMTDDLTRYINIARDHLGIRIVTHDYPPTLEAIPWGYMGEFLGKLLGGCKAMGWYEGSWHQVHHTLLSHGHAIDLVDFARLGLGRRWLRAERLIAEDPEAVLMYAAHVIQGRWEDGEHTLLRSPNHTYAVTYAIKVLQRRWIPYEIQKDPMSCAWARYVDHFNLYKDN